MSFNETQNRWDGFLKKIEDRFEEILEKTEAALPLLFKATDFETTTFHNAWQGIYSQANELIWKIDSTWDDKVEEAFENAGAEFGSKKFIQERDKGYLIKFKLEQKLKSYEVKIFADAAKKLLQEVKDTLSKDFCCTQCQAKLPVKDNFFRSYYSTCEYCQTVNTFEPGTKARNIEHFAIHALGEEAALEHYLQYEELKFQNYIQDSETYSKEELTPLYQKYVEAYLKKRIEIIPDYKDRYEKDLKAKTAFLTNY
ncbi:hypothetical protein ATO12_18670 [Aquimarina atlantica]|uniref:Uncharacterized protein n=1 Tax=Aquimarina atlantica TaxID=1317122 RepID=A0A023BSV0_9FLAO|nr:hypothetical protein [Aquimarina atlantica]EZH73040.1 hypothetical protein ATO12_18670 [Aquimarina atlantica]